MNVKRLVIWVAGLLVLGLVAEIHGFMKLRPASLQDGPASPSSATDTAVHSQVSPNGTGAEPRSNEKIVAEFRDLAACAKYKRINTGIQILKNDPMSWLNNDEVRSGLSTEQLQDVESAIEFAERNSEKCAPFLSEDVAVNASKLYHSALLAGRTGDLQAAKCYVLAPWPFSETFGDAPSKQLRDKYVANVDKMIDVGIKGGDWGMVDLLINSYGSSTTGLRAIGLPQDLVKSYGYQRLQRIGAKGKLAAQADATLSMLSTHLTPQQKADRERWATDAFSKYFIRSPSNENSEAGCDW
jgi:hypothetical protein